MKKCFVIQPFDRDKFDKRYVDVYEPAIIAAGLEPYRVDRDPSVIIPIEQIELGIKNSQICFADITIDNPNVWYELGFAFASGKDVVMVCSLDERTGKFPFDIQHKLILTYKTGSKSDFVILEKNITERIVALLGKQKIVKEIINNPLKESEGLKPHEVAMLLLLMENQLTDEDSVSIYSVREDMNKSGYNYLATSISIRELKRKGFINTFKEYSEYNNEEYLAAKLTDIGIQWVLNNQDKIEFRNQAKVSQIDEDNLPF